MKTSIAKLALGLTLVSMSGVAMAGIAATKHNLGASNTAGSNHTDATTEICVFCHTPHGGDITAAVPLWNRHLSSTVTYTTYSQLGTSTLDATSAPIGSVSLACLSCHDGTQAMDVMINTPGSDTTGQLDPGSMSGPNGWEEFQAMSNLSTDDMVYLGTDLRNDHPISIQYAGALTGGSFARAANDLDFFTATAAPAALSGTVVYYIEADGVGGKSKHDLPLYNRAGGTVTSTGLNLQLLTGQPLVECATCHDPHTQNTTFLRHPSGNNGSATCLTCHNK